VLCRSPESTRRWVACQLVKPVVGAPRPADVKGAGVCGAGHGRADRAQPPGRPDTIAMSNSRGAAPVKPLLHLKQSGVTAAERQDISTLLAAQDPRIDDAVVAVRDDEGRPSLKVTSAHHEEMALDRDRKTRHGALRTDSKSCFAARDVTFSRGGKGHRWALQGPRRAAPRHSETPR